MRPHSCKSWQKILVLCEFDLSLCVGCLCPLGKYVEDEICPVEYPAVQFPLYVSQLGRGELVIENDDICLIFLNPGLYFLQFSAADVCPCIRLVYFLYESFLAFCPCCLSQEFKFVEVFQHLPFVVILLDNPDEYCLFSVFFFDVHLFQVFYNIKKGDRIQRLATLLMS